MNVRELEGQSAISRVPVYQRRREKATESAGGIKCSACAKKSHEKDEKCPAVGRKCHRCNEFNHFAPCCPSKPKFVKAVTDRTDSAKIGSVAVRNIQGKPQRRAPTISLQLLDRQGKCVSTVHNATPDGGAEVTVAETDVMRALGHSERDLQHPTFDLVQAEGGQVDSAAIRWSVGRARALRVRNRHHDSLVLSRDQRHFDFVD